jgi:hypothetical protein
MPSKDFMYDLLDKLEKDRQEYLLVTPTVKRREVVIDVNYWIENEESARATVMTLKKLIEKLEGPEHDDDEEEEWFLREDGEE